MLLGYRRDAFDDAATGLDDPGAWCEAHPAESLIAALAAQGVAAAVVNTGSGMYAANLEKQNDVFLRSPCGDLVKGFPFQFARTPMTVHLDSPAVGEHTADFVRK